LQQRLITSELWQRKQAEFVRRQDRITAVMGEHRDADRSYLEDGNRILELAQRAYSLYVRQEPDEQRKLADILLSNCTLKGGRVHAELKEVFAILADGAEQEEAMVAAGAPKSAIDENWLPVRNPLRNVLGS